MNSWRYVRQYLVGVAVCVPVMAVATWLLDVGWSGLPLAGVIAVQLPISAFVTDYGREPTSRERRRLMLPCMAVFVVLEVLALGVGELVAPAWTGALIEGVGGLFPGVALIMLGMHLVMMWLWFRFMPKVVVQVTAKKNAERARRLGG
ncbi:ABZJ_00895 family protein [Gordonia humi]|uniref:Putative membrane protein n=1 Tax=Gordonia humi TaxID=686429 RepID=A0A840EZD3_9ACTN|nr:ABZJ_00895 family protein [Gordonia humi]MBB4134379.1 putative membrane protein [Gordonia humi]